MLASYPSVAWTRIDDERHYENEEMMSDGRADPRNATNHFEPNWLRMMMMMGMMRKMMIKMMIHLCLSLVLGSIQGAARSKPEAKMTSSG